MLSGLLRIRLSYYYVIFFATFVALLAWLPQLKLSSGQLALFSVNSFLFGYYFGPILSSQKLRVESLAKTIRQEEMAILDILANSHLLEDKVRHELKVKLRKYVDSVTGNVRVAADNPYYDDLLQYVKQPRFKDDSVMDTIYNRLAQTQQDRDTMNLLYGSKIFGHEWIVLWVLFGVTLFFVMQTDFGHSLWFMLLLAVLCTGLSLLMLILIKYATLTHKQAKRMWQPMHDLVKNHFEDVPKKELKA